MGKIMKTRFFFFFKSKRKITESGGLVVTSRTLIREVPGSIPGASYLGEGSVVVLHHQANAGVNPT